MSINEPVGDFKFGGNTIKADRTGKFTIKLMRGGEWSFDIDEISKMDEFLSEFEAGITPGEEKIFWRTNGS